MKGWRGFTLVELVVVIAVIAILTTLATLGLSRYLADGRDNERAANVTAVSEALEKYYDQNGEYPSCSALTADGSTVTNTTLKGLDASALLVPGASSSTTNSIKCGSTLTINGEDFIEYVGDGSPDCSGSGSCLAYKLKYKSEIDNVIKEVDSRRQQDIATSGKPTVTVTDVNVETVDLSWTPVSNASQYIVQRATNSSFTTNLQQFSSSNASTTVNGLTSVTLYYFRVAASNGPYTGQWSDVVSATTLSLGKPTITGSTMNSVTQLTINWSTVAGAESYTIQRATNSTFTTGLVQATGITGTSSAQSSLTTGTLYYFRVRAHSGSTTGDWSTTYQGGTTTVPSGVAATSASCGGATVSWNASTGATSYTLQYSTSSSFTSATSVTGITGTSSAPSGLPQNTTVYFRVYALVGSSKTAASSTVNALITICAPTSNTLSCSGGSSASCTSNAVCAAGTTVNYQWYANGGAWVSGDQYKSVSYGLGYGQGITLSLNTRCYSGSAYSGWSSAGSYGYTRAVPAPTLNALASGGGRRVNASWSGVCGGLNELLLQQGSYTDTSGNRFALPNNYGTTDTRVWYSAGTVIYHVRTLCNGVWSGWSNQQSRYVS